jgi:predicted protein tyrosine phosphatase
MPTRRVLFVCEGNLHRSPTAERLYANVPGLKTRSAGLSSLAKVQLTVELMEWADVIMVMEKRLLRMFKKQFPDNTANIVCLNVPDEFQRDQPELIEILTEQLTPYLGSPAAT